MMFNVDDIYCGRFVLLESRDLVRGQVLAVDAPCTVAPTPAPSL